MYKIAVLGDRDSIYGFAALGLDTYPVYDPTEAVRTLRRLAEGNYAVIYITEALAAEIDEEISRIIGEAYARCLAILEENRARLVTVAEYLLAHETMSAADFETVFTDNAEKME